MYSVLSIVMRVLTVDISSLFLHRNGRFPLDEFLRAKRLFLLSHELSTGTNDGSIQFKQ